MGVELFHVHVPQQLRSAVVEEVASLEQIFLLTICALSKTRKRSANKICIKPSNSNS